MKSTGKKIFIVDDDKWYAALIEKYLSEVSDHFFEYFEDGVSMLSKLHYEPDLIILDYHLNGENGKHATGMEVLYELKELSPNIPVIMLSGLQDVQIAVDLLKYKATDYVVKDSNAPKKLEAAIDGLFQAQNVIGEKTSLSEKASRVRKQMILSFSVIALVVLLLFLL